MLPWISMNVYNIIDHPYYHVFRLLFILASIFIARDSCMAYRKDVSLIYSSPP
jgi:hypothetical protein